MNKKLQKDIERILLLKPLYVKPGTSKRTSREIMLIHKRDELLTLFTKHLSDFGEKIKKILKEAEIECQGSCGAGCEIAVKKANKSIDKYMKGVE